MTVTRPPLSSDGSNECRARGAGEKRAVTRKSPFTASAHFQSDDGQADASPAQTETSHPFTGIAVNVTVPPE